MVSSTRLLPTVKVAVLAFDGFDELDTFITLGLINRLRPEGWSAEIVSPHTRLSSMNGVTLDAQQPLEYANEADIVLFGSSLYARALAENSAVLDRLQLDPLRQFIGAQGSGVLLMARLGLLADQPASTDPSSKPWVVEAGVRVVDAPFHARGPVATASGGLAAQYLAAWAMWRRGGRALARQALHTASPVGEKDVYVNRLLDAVQPFVPTA